MKKRVEWVDLAKGITILSVIVFHTIWGTPLSEYIKNLIGSFHMALFFILSGTMLTLSVNWENWAGRLVKSFQKLMLPALILFAYSVVLEYHSNFELYSLNKRLFLQTKLQSLFYFSTEAFDLKGSHIQGVGIIWFLLAMFLSRAIYDGIGMVCKNRKWLGIISFACGVLGTFIGTKTYLPLEFDIVLAVLPYYFIGSLLSKETNSKTDGRKALLYIVIWFTSFTVMYRLTGQGYSAGSKVYPWYPYCIAVAVLGTLAVAYLCKWMSSAKYGFPVLNCLGQNSMILLLIHIWEDDTFKIHWAMIENEPLRLAERLCLDLAIFAVILLIRKSLRGGWRKNAGIVGIGSRRICSLCALASFLITTGIMLCIYYLKNYAPFGQLSMTWNDAEIQYLDFFAYYKDLLAGNNTIGYSFTKALGGSNIGLFSYYLASPFNLLLLFFDKAHLNAAFDLIIALKLGLAACTMSIFLNFRFLRGNTLIAEINSQTKAKEQPESKIQAETKHQPEFNAQVGLGKHLAVVILAVSFGLCQYSIAQSANIMWLDGVYMLPLLLLGLYQIMHGKKSLLLTVSVGLAILFNWYTAAIDLIFTAFYALFELLLIWGQRGYQSGDIKKTLHAAGRYIYAVVLGLLLSMALFLPTVGALRKNSGGSLDFKSILDFTIIGQPWNVILGFQAGALSTQGQVALFCGLFAVTGCLLFLISWHTCIRQKLAGLAILIITILLFYFQPFVKLFSLFNPIAGYWYRYSYVGIFVIILLGAYYWLVYFETDFHRIWNILSQKARVYAVLAVAILTFAELTYNASEIMNSSHDTEISYHGNYLCTASSNAAYANATMQLIAKIREEQEGKEFSRISQTNTRDPYFTGLTANYNESLAYNYPSIVGYSSITEDVQTQLLEALGYRRQGDYINVVNTSVLTSDTLLGVKYLLSNAQIKGYSLLETDTNTDRQIYTNDYALPMAFTYTKAENDLASYDGNTFAYQNALYSELLGREVEPYQPVEYEVTDGTAEDGSPYREYELKVPEGNYSLYGYLPWNSDIYGTLDCNGMDQRSYACYLSESVFYIPTAEEQQNAYVRLTGLYPIDMTEGSEQFYALDLDLFKEVTEELTAGKADTIDIQNGAASFTVKDNKDDFLYVSIPYDEDWTITVNGKEVEPGLFADAFYSIPLEQGDNEIVMQYHIRYLWQGILLTILGLLGTAAVYMLEKKKVKNM